MQQASDDLQFEKAGAIRDQLIAIERVVEKQKVICTEQIDSDVIAFARSNGEACVQIFFIRAGKLIGREYFVLEGTEEETNNGIVEQFVKQFYDEAAYIPPEVLLPEEIEEARIINEWLNTKRGGEKVTLTVPRRGPKRGLVEMAAENAAETLASLKAQWEADTNKHVQALAELQTALSLPQPPNRIECYDISNTQGTAATASMVVFEQGRAQEGPLPALQHQIGGWAERLCLDARGPHPPLPALARGASRAGRRRGAEGRRWAGLGWTARRQRETGAGGGGRRADGRPADEGGSAGRSGRLVLGARHTAAPAPSRTEGRRELCAPARPADRRRRARASWAWRWKCWRNMACSTACRWSAWPSSRRKSSCPASRGRCCCRAARRGCTWCSGCATRPTGLRWPHHRIRRGKIGLASQLDAIPGIGPARRRALLTRFGSLAGIREATLDDLATVRGMTRAAAEVLKASL